MVSIEKIKNNVDNNIIETINILANEGDKERLINWLKECKEEIERRQQQKENCYSLYLEKEYLEYILQ